jgi:DNA repair ATPase RecN
LTSAIQELNEKVNNTNNNNDETEIIRPTLQRIGDSVELRCVEISRINELYDRISSIEAENISLKNANNELSVKLDEVNNNLQSKPKAEQKVEIEESDSGGITMVESLQERLYKAEQLISKQDKMIKKLTTAVNKLLKEA